MFDNIFGTLMDLWNNTYNAEDWSAATLVIAVFVTLFASLVFTYRMSRYDNKGLLDWAILLREVGWLLVAVRSATTVGFNWDWRPFGWLLWSYIALVTFLALFASQREHYIAKYKNRGPRWRFRNQKEDVVEQDSTNGNA